MPYELRKRMEFIIRLRCKLQPGQASSIVATIVREKRDLSPMFHDFSHCTSIYRRMRDQRHGKLDWCPYPCPFTNTNIMDLQIS